MTTMKTKVKEIKSKRGISFRLEFDDRKEQVKVTCLSAVGFCSFLKREIHAVMNPLNLKVVEEGFEDITYKCPSYKKKKVVEAVKEF